MNCCVASYDPNLVGNLNVVPKYSEFFKLDASLLGLNLALVNAGQVVTGPFTGAILDRWGRRVGMMVGSSFLLLATILQATATTEAQLAVGRFFVGICLGIVLTGAPTWVMELAPPKHRGVYVGFLISALLFMGVLVGLTVLWTYNLNSNWAWRTGFVVEGAFALVAIILLAFMDESPRWLVYKGHHQEALDVIARLHGNNNRDDAMVQLQMSEITETLKYESENEGTWKTLISPRPNLHRFSIAILTQIFYQLTGSNTLLSYFPLILSSAGIHDTRMLIIINMCIFGGTFFLTPIGGLLSEQIGRRKLFLVGTTGMAACLAALAILGHFGEGGGRVFGICAIVAVVIFQFSSSLSWMLLSFSYPLEVLKFSQRAKGMAIAQSIGYLFSFLNLYTIPIAIEKIGWRYYAVNAGWDAAIIVVVFLFFKETKGRTLEEIDGVFENRYGMTLEITPGEEERGTVEDSLQKKPKTEN
ncbi:hypothetical protein CEP51_016157 [Fusarium floridanum]|uniref:Major facilitator superfamily (MFS) profile domain-containing protein n=1 Tax=Fusarium floridanum TaxID=1325733 RepID=A0A428NW77_9HYPO|nr:hypothetical protein CEP51_016157 [Fusarium floridanum]